MSPSGERVRTNLQVSICALTICTMGDLEKPEIKRQMYDNQSLKASAYCVHQFVFSCPTAWITEILILPNSFTWIHLSDDQYLFALLRRKSTLSHF